MKLVFSLFIAIALGLGAFQLSTQSWESGYQAAREEILKESSEKAAQLSQSNSDNSPRVREVFKPEAGGKPAILSGPAVTPAAAAGRQPASQIDVQPKSFVGINQQNKIRYWCKLTSVVVPTGREGKCSYPSACFYCESARAEIIPPTSPEASPVCDDGSPPQLESIVCCPRAYVDSKWECPDFQTCFEDTESKCGNS